MKREIKFRAFQDNQMLVSPISSNYGLTRFFGLLYEDAPIMQFTGLRDKNGRDIYEGDIVTVQYGKGFVVHNAAMFMIEWIDDKEAMMESLAFDTNSYKYGRTRKDLEVIGNIYENPELLKP